MAEPAPSSLITSDSETDEQNQPLLTQQQSRRPRRLAAEASLSELTRAVLLNANVFRPNMYSVFARMCLVGSTIASAFLIVHAVFEIIERHHSESAAIGCFVVLMLLIPGVCYVNSILQTKRFRSLGPVGYFKGRYTWCVSLYGKKSTVAGNALFAVGKLHEMLNEPEQALEVYQSVLSDYDVLCRLPPSGAIVHRTIGLLQYRTGQFPEALESLDAALEAQQVQSGHVLRLHDDFHAIAAVHEKMGNFDAALEKRQGAWQVLADQGYTQLWDAGLCLTKMAATYEAMGHLDLAMEKLEGALEILLLNEGEFPRTSTVARLYSRIGTLEEKMGSSGDDHFSLAVEVYRRGGMSDEHPILLALLPKQKGSDDIEQQMHAKP